MKRRQRANSVEADLHDITSIHETMRRHAKEVGNVTTSESHARRVIIEIEETQRRRVTAHARVGLRDIAFKRTRADQQSRPPPMVAAMGDLFMKSKAKDEAAREERDRQRFEARQERIRRYKATQREVLDRIATTRATAEDKRHEHIVAERHRRREALQFSHDSILDERSYSAMGVVEDRKRRKRDQEAAEHHRRVELRNRIAAGRDRSASPSLFLKLPPLFQRDSSDMRTDLKLLRMLRDESAARSSIPIDEFFVDSARTRTPSI
jgi:hypothetical protein